VRKRLMFLITLLAAALTVAGLLPASAASGSPAHGSAHRLRPIVFVHGFSGSGAQFETPARRFESNGYPSRYITAVDYDSTFAGAPITSVYDTLDARITELLASTHADRVDLVGHSLGTAVSQGYLSSSPARAARVAHYVNLDGASAASLPGGVPTLGVWAQLNPNGSIGGATEVRFPQFGHTESVTAPETFTEMYRFFNGRPPRTTRIVPTRFVTLEGRAVLFPANAGVQDTRLDVYRVSARTGRRVSSRPVASFALSGDGSFGPFRGLGSARYEFALVRGGTTHHLYYEPFQRTDRLIRLLTSNPGEGVDALSEKSPTTTNLTIARYKEWWEDADRLTINGASVLPGVAPRSKLAIALFTFDAGLDGVTHLGAPVPALATLPFLTGVDLAIPSSRRSVSLVADNRGAGRSVIRVPAWPSATDRISIQVDDH
jgi:pimeloyl-ACP methyl ester carboxylesterase